MSILSNITFLEKVVYWASTISLIALLLSFVGGGTSILFNRWLNRAKDIEAKRIQDDNNLKITSLNLKIAEANQKAAEANQKAESERLARLKLEAKLANRTLTDEQKAHLTSLLKPFAGTEADFMTFGNAFEVNNISNTILTCLKTAGWNLHIGHGVTGVTAWGICVGFRPGSAPNIALAAGTLVSGLQSMGISAGIINYSEMPYSIYHSSEKLTEAPLRIFIGDKSNQ